jgi:hypothetical protein
MRNSTRRRTWRMRKSSSPVSPAPPPQPGPASSRELNGHIRVPAAAASALLIQLCREWCDSLLRWRLWGGSVRSVLLRRDSPRLTRAVPWPTRWHRAVAAPRQATMRTGRTFGNNPTPPGSPWALPRPADVSGCRARWSSAPGRPPRPGPGPGLSLLFAPR